MVQSNADFWLVSLKKDLVMHAAETNRLAEDNIRWAEEAPTEWEKNYRIKKAEIYYKAAQVYLDAITELETESTG